MESPPVSPSTAATTSSSRSRTKDPWVVDPTSDPLPQKLRLMCSYGGYIVPRPHDKSLCYIGGDTRMIVVNRHSITLSSLSSHLSKTLINNTPFTLKYQLPNEDLDSLITVSTDEDLDNMIEEYDRTLSSHHSTVRKSSRLRLFLFPLKPDSSQSIGPLLDSSTRSDDWFWSALKGAGLLHRGFSDSAALNCLLGFDDDLGMNNTDFGSRDADVNSNSLPGSVGSEKSGKHSQDVHSVADSAMLELKSSFGSTSTFPSIADLPPVCVTTEERLVRDQKLGIEEQFAQMVMGSSSASGGGGVGRKHVQQEEGYVMMSSGAVTGNIPVTRMPVGVAPGEFRVYSDDERSDHGVPIGYQRLPIVGHQTQQQQQPPQAQGQPPQAQSQQKSSGGLDLPSPDSVSRDQAEVVRRIVSHVTQPLKTWEDDYLVAIEQPMQNVVEMLQISSTDVRMVGICGIPGIGKTTLAKALYHRLLPQFERCCFISSIDERSVNYGLNSLQGQLIEELLHMKYKNFCSFEDNLNFIKYKICSIRVLIVLDDVECLDHIKAFGVDLQCFGPGSRIILTTQKPELLVEAKVPHRYFVEELDVLHSLNLFYSYAFEKDSPEGEYSHLSAEIAVSSRGIPQVIQSVGSYLSNYRNKEKDRWEEVLQLLRSCQYEPLQWFLMLRNDNLSKGRWHFYHDKACFPMGGSNDIAHYDVVLSFDAQDRVKNLVESLHKRMESFGIGVFALNGDSTPVDVTGKIFIPVISKSYASNSSCLEMLAHMVKCRRISATNHILHILFAFEPSSDDRLLTPLCESCSSWSLPETFTTEEFYSLINSVCQTALDKLKLNQSMENQLVGIDEHVESILNLLNSEVNDVRIIAIRGEDGTGKTTLAKVVYHQLSSSFEGCSFLTNIEERTQCDDGIRYLQAKLISDLLNIRCEVFTSVNEGISIIKQRFQHMKVLIVLDDVGKGSYVKDLVGQLDWFGPRSRIIITANVTTEIPLPHSNYVIQQRWGFDKLYELFSMHAFRKGHPLPNLRSLSMDMVAQLCRFSNPCVALEIVGSLLYGKDEEEWQNMSQNLRDKDLKRILRMSYGRLDEMQKKTFLDISCIPINLDRQIASYLWYNSFHSSAFVNIESLILVLLVRVDANNEIWMHQVARHFGREIADQGETELVQLEFPASPGFERMDNVRFLKLSHANASGSTNCVSMRQRDFIWQCPPDLLAQHHFQCLEVLDMSWSKITEDWEVWDKIEVPQLRVLNLTGCNVMLTPNFSFCPKLEMLILEHCSRLVKIDPSIGKLQHLTTLNLRYCHELSVLPQEVGCLTALRELPLDGTSLQEIPFSIGHLENLHFLTAINCFSLIHSSDSTHELQSVTISKLDFADISELPFFIGEKMKLRHLSLRGCRGLKTLPALAGVVKSSLVELDVSETSISELPKSIIKLKALRVLKMDFCFITEFPPGFKELKRLEEIHASWCRNLKQIPNDIGELNSLRILTLRNTRISNVPESIQYLGCLQTFDCTSCNKLHNLPKLPSSLTSLHVESKKLRELPDYAYLTRLEELTLVSGDSRDPLNWLQRCSSLRTLRLCLPPNTDLPGFPSSLKILRILHCRKLEHMPPLPSTLVVLSVQDCMSLVEQPNVENLENLEEMEIMDCPKIEKIGGLEILQALRVLTISGSGIKSLKGLDKLTSLTTLNICHSMREFLDPSTLNCVDVHWL